MKFNFKEKKHYPYYAIFILSFLLCSLWINREDTTKKCDLDTRWEHNGRMYKEVDCLHDYKEDSYILKLKSYDQ